MRLINWLYNLSIYTSRSFLKAVGDEYGWIGGIDDSGKLSCVLPYTELFEKQFALWCVFGLRPFCWGEELEVQEEKSFLNSAIEFFRFTGTDVIILVSTNTIFQT